MFEKEYRMLSFVPRWAIAPRHNRQTVAEHSFYVALYASQICDVLGINLEDKAAILDYALRHDALEAWTGDIPGPAKRAIKNDASYAAYENQFAEKVPDYNQYNHPFLVVKLAGMIDEIFFLKTEIGMGNHMVYGLYNRSLERMWVVLKQLDSRHPGMGIKQQVFGALELEVDRLIEKGAYIPNRDEDIQQ